MSVFASLACGIAAFFLGQGSLLDKSRDALGLKKINTYIRCRRAYSSYLYRMQMHFHVRRVMD